MPLKCSFRWSKEKSLIESSLDDVKVVITTPHHSERRDIFSVCIGSDRVSFATTRSDSSNPSGLNAGVFEWKIEEIFYLLTNAMASNEKLIGTKNIVSFDSVEQQDLYVSALKSALSVYSNKPWLTADDQTPAIVVFQEPLLQGLQNGKYIK